MATYKVLQDIEAEDKLLGPLSLRQFIYAAIVICLGFVGFRLGTIAWYLALPFLPPFVFFGLLAAPFGRDQSSEVWLLGKIRFLIKPRKRIWDQSGLKELVTITVPKKIEKVYTKGFSQDEVKSRLNALASTLDTRGWAVKNVDVATFRQPLVTAGSSERLVSIDSMPQAVPYDVPDASADILDEHNNPVARSVDTLMTASAQSHRQELLSKMRNLTAPPVAAPAASPSPAAQINTDDNALLEQLKEQNDRARLSQAHLRNITPVSPMAGAAAATPSAPIAPQEPAASTPPAVGPPQAQAVTATADPVILGLVKNDDLNVATIARQANKQSRQDSSDEVVISLR